MKKFASLRVTVAIVVLLLGAFHHMQAQENSGLPAGSSSAARPRPSRVQNCNGGALTKLSFAATNGQESATTTSTTFVDLAPLSITFNLPGTLGTCLKVDVTAETYAETTNGLILMRVLLDGTTELFPGEVQFSGDDGSDARSHAMNFYTFDVRPGTHNVRVQWRSGFGGSVFAYNRSMGVLHH